MLITKSSRSQHDSPKKNRLVGAIKAGMSITEAARLTGIPCQTASDIWHKYIKTGTTHNRPRSGRPHKVTDHMKALVVRRAVKERRVTFAEIGNQVDPKISEGTVRSILKERGYGRRIARQVPFLTKKQKKARMHWAQKYKSFTSQDWQEVAFSDECYIYLGDDRGRIYITRRPDEVLREECLVPTFKQSSICVMVWACIIQGRKGPLIVLEYPGGRGGGMNTARYREQVLDGVFLDWYKEMKLQRGPITFQQDNAPCHTSKSTQRWFTDHEIPLLFHPPNSPDLNPIERVWHELKSALRNLRHPPNTQEQLQAAVHHVWDELPIEDVNKHINWMPDRVEAVLAAHGGHTSF